MSEIVKKEPEQILLWPDGNIPYMQEGSCIPNLKAYPVEGSKGAMVICPGGAYRAKAAHEGGPVAEMLNEAGISAYVLDYRISPCHYDAPLADAHRAIRLLRHMGYEKVGIMGFSAGGHLTCSAATLYDPGDADAADPVDRLSSRPDAFVPCYAVTSFATFRQQGSVAALLGDARNDYRLISRFSAEMHVTPDTPPAFIWHTSDDEGVSVKNSLDLARALSRVEVPYELHVYPHGRHGMGLAKNSESVGQWTGQLKKWLLTMGFGAK